MGESEGEGMAVNDEGSVVGEDERREVGEIDGKLVGNHDGTINEEVDGILVGMHVGESDGIEFIVVLSIHIPPLSTTAVRY